MEPEVQLRTDAQHQVAEPWKELNLVFFSLAVVSPRSPQRTTCHGLAQHGTILQLALAERAGALGDDL